MCAVRRGSGGGRRPFVKSSTKFWILAAAVALIDQATKNLVLHHLDAESEISFLGAYGRSFSSQPSGLRFFQAFRAFSTLDDLRRRGPRVYAFAPTGLYPLGL